MMLRTHALALPLAALLGLAGCSREAEAPPAAEGAKAEAPAADGAAAPVPGYKEIEAPGAAKDAATAFRSDTADIVVAAQGTPGDKLEYKLQMKAGDVLTYSWEAQDAQDFWHEFHGHTADTVAFYKKATGTAHRGVLTAPFDGIHGWYFENRTPNLVVVRVRTGGFYELVPDEAK